MILNTDGGARGNPGPGAAAAILKTAGGKQVKEVGKFLGICTNNEAEYHGLILGLETALVEGVSDLQCNLDSELVVKQLNGQYKVKNERIAVLFKKIRVLETKFKNINYTHVPRSQNYEADALVNHTLDSVS